MKCPNHHNGSCTTHGEVNPAKLLGGIKTPKASDASRRNGRKSKGRPKGSKNKPKDKSFKYVKTESGCYLEGDIRNLL